MLAFALKKRAMIFGGSLDELVVDLVVLLEETCCMRPATVLPCPRLAVVAVFVVVFFAGPVGLGVWSVLRAFACVFVVGLYYGWY